MEKKRVLVSACLLGIECRFDGKSKENSEFEFFPVCPEVLGGLATPRVPSEIIDGKVINKDGIDVTQNYIKGAYDTLKICNICNIDFVVFKSKSPSCGKGKIYDGTFSGNLIDGNGITTQILLDNSIKVYTEDEFINEYKDM